MLRMSQVLLAMLIGLAAFHSIEAQTSARDQRMIAYTKNIQISRLDPRLPRQRLDPWIRSLIGNAPQQWQISQCAEQPDPTTRETSQTICGKLFSQLPDGRQLRLWIAIGTRKKGVQGPPTLWLAYFGVAGQEKPAAKLSDLPELVHSVVGRQPIS
jgi:hypothetical protein